MESREETLRRIRYSGFTLLELLVSLAIAAAVMVGVQAAVSVAVDVAARDSDRADTSLRIEAVRAAITRWLESAHLDDAFEGAGFVGMDAASLRKPRDELTFITLDPALLGDADGGAVHIRLRVAAGDTGLVADYRTNDAAVRAGSGAPDANPVTGNEAARESGVASLSTSRQGTEQRPRAEASIVLLPDVSGLEIRYLVALGDELRWFAGWSSRVRLPRAVELRFFRDRQTGEPNELIEAPLQVALPAKG